MKALPFVGTDAAGFTIRWVQCKGLLSVVLSSLSPTAFMFIFWETLECVVHKRKMRVLYGSRMDDYWGTSPGKKAESVGTNSPSVLQTCETQRALRCYWYQ